MSKKRLPKTSGYEWLSHSIAAFNGTGYADRDSPVSFLISYIDYNHWKKREEAVDLAMYYWAIILDEIAKLLQRPTPSGKASAKHYARFQASRKLERLL